MNTQDRCIALGVRLRHFAPSPARNGVTVAYREVSPTLIEISTATCSRLDKFIKKIGNDVALTNFEEGKVVHIPLYRRVYGVRRDDNIGREEIIQATLEDIFGRDINL